MSNKIIAVGWIVFSLLALARGWYIGDGELMIGAALMLVAIVHLIVTKWRGRS